METRVQAEPTETVWEVQLPSARLDGAMVSVAAPASVRSQSSRVAKVEVGKGCG